MDDVQAGLQCLECLKTFGRPQDLSTHKMRSHGIIPPLALRTRTTTCKACGSQLGTRVRLLEHLRKKQSCGLWVLHNEPPMSAEDYSACISELNSVNELLTRQVPRTGPIPL
eukprot:2730771-Amphidinium_carterae.1